jgi:integrase
MEETGCSLMPSVNHLQNPTERMALPGGIRCDVELTTGTIRVRQTVYEGQFGTPKTKRSRRVVPLSPIAVQILVLQKQGSGTSLIFSSATGTALWRRNLLNRQFRPTAVRLGLKGFNWHWLRHGANLAGAYLVRGDEGALHSCGLLGVAKCGGSDRGIGDWPQMDPEAKSPRL